MPSSEPATAPAPVPVLAAPVGSSGTPLTDPWSAPDRMPRAGAAWSRAAIAVLIGAAAPAARLCAEHAPIAAAAVVGASLAWCASLLHLSAPRSIARSVAAVVVSLGFVLASLFLGAGTALLFALAAVTVAAVATGVVEEWSDEAFVLPIPLVAAAAWSWYHGARAGAPFVFLCSALLTWLVIRRSSRGRTIDEALRGVIDQLFGEWLPLLVLAVVALPFVYVPGALIRLFRWVVGEPPAGSTRWRPVDYDLAVVMRDSTFPFSSPSLRVRRQRLAMSALVAVVGAAFVLVVVWPS